MPQFLKIDATQWINPALIVHIEDNPTWDTPTIDIVMAAVQTRPSLYEGKSSELDTYTLTLTGPARERVLHYLAHNAATVPGDTT